MACFSVFCNNGVFLSRQNLEFKLGKNKPSWRCRNLDCSSDIFPSARYRSHCQFPNGVSHQSKLKSMVNDKNGFFSFELGKSRKSCFGLSCSTQSYHLRSQESGLSKTHVRRRGKEGLRRRFSLRLRPRLRLLKIKLRRASVRLVLNNFGTFLRKNIRTVTVSSIVTIFLGFCYLFLKITALPHSKVVPYSEFVMSLQNGTVTNVLLEEGSRRIYFNGDSQNLDSSQDDPESSSNSIYNENLVDEAVNMNSSRNVQASSISLSKIFPRSQSRPPEWQYSTRKVDRDEKFLLSLMREKGTVFGSAPQSVLTSMRSTLITIITLWIPLIPLMWLLYRQLSAANSPGRKRQSNRQTIGFEDVEGVDSAKVELMEIVACLQGAINYQKLGAKLPRGVLLIGPPGTGKTLLARAVAGEAGVPFFTVSASEFVELFVGRGAARIRDLFNVARKSSPSIVFIDELDAVGGKRGRSFNDERDQTLNQLLTEMDGFESDTKVIVIAATNRPEALDPALCRPGRFSRKVVVGEPDEEGRRKILAVHFRGIPLDEDPDMMCNLVASLTPGFVGADLANIVNEAALLAARRGNESVMREDVMEAIERSKYGIKQMRTRSTIGEELGRLFPWMPPSLMGRRNDGREDGPQGPLLGYQTLS